MVWLMKQLGTPLRLLLCAFSLATMVASDGSAPATVAILSSNPLKGLPALHTPHFSWPFPEPGQYMHIPTRLFCSF